MSASVITMMGGMGRWEPDARGRLEQAALELFRERGFEQTTTAEIAKRAGLTERTFFRHFADKREVLFGGAARFQERVVGSVAAAPAGVPPIDAVAAGLDAVAGHLQDLRTHSIARYAVITATPELQERELIKLASLASAVAETLRTRGVPEPAASLSAEAGIAAFKVAYERWVEGGQEQELGDLIRDSLRALNAVTAAATPA